jgi:SAM-dependent methyltransferase
MHVARAREFFGPRARDWDARFPDDAPAYEQAARELAPRPGGIVVDLGCGTGRALPALRAVAGPAATVIGIDVTVEMLEAARAHRRDDAGALVLGDVLALPLRQGRVDAIFAAGLVAHVPDPAHLLAGLAAWARPGARLALFHPIGRAALAARQHRELSSTDVLDPVNVRRVLANAGWTPELVDDSDERYLTLARLEG